MVPFGQRVIMDLPTGAFLSWIADMALSLNKRSLGLSSTRNFLVNLSDHIFVRLLSTCRIVQELYRDQNGFRHQSLKACNEVGGVCTFVK